MNLRRLIQIENRRISILERRWAGRLRTALRKQGKNYLKNGELGDAMFEALSEMYKTVSSNYLKEQYNWLQKDVQKMSRFFMAWELWTAEQIASGYMPAGNTPHTRFWRLCKGRIQGIPKNNAGPGSLFRDR